MRDSETRRRPRAPLPEMLLVIGLPLAAVIAGIVTVVIASQQGFTPAAEQVAPKGH